MGNNIIMDHFEAETGAKKGGSKKAIKKCASFFDHSWKHSLKLEKEFTVI